MITNFPKKITIVKKIIRTCFSKGEFSYLSKILKQILYIKIIKLSKYFEKKLKYIIKFSSSHIKIKYVLIKYMKKSNLKVV